MVGRVHVILAELYRAREFRIRVTASQPHLTYKYRTSYI